MAKKKGKKVSIETLNAVVVLLLIVMLITLFVIVSQVL